MIAGAPAAELGSWPAPNESAPALLIVDDEAVNRRFFRAVLQDIGADVYLAASGAQALAECMQREFAMILLDVGLLDMSGFEFARRLREAEPAVTAPIVFVSAVYTHQEDAFRAYDLGAVDYLVTPVLPSILRAKAAVFIRMYRMHHQALAQRAAIDLSYRELRVAHSELEHFSYSASHDLRTPLHQIASLAELVSINSGATMDAKSRNFLTRVVDATKRMNTLIDNLLALSRITAGVLDPAPVDLSALAREIAGELCELQPKRRVRWNLADGLNVHGNAGLLRAALSNLLGNAWKYSAGSDAPQIDFGSFAGDQQTVYFVGDNGAGFDIKEAGDRLFRPFQRFNSSGAFEGTGVGLAIVHRVIVKHGGTLWAESTPGQGARFLFTLPQPETPAVAPRIGLPA